MKHEIRYYPNGNKKDESYLNDSNKHHNELGPAVIWYYENGKKSSESYYINDQLHNVKEPAYIKYDENGNKNCEAYYINGKMHNINGPALILYGNIERNSYYLDGIRINVNSDEEFQKYIKRLNIS